MFENHFFGEETAVSASSIATILKILSKKVLKVVKDRCWSVLNYFELE
jgi:hypothetical protein